MAPAMASASDTFGWFYYQTGKVATKVDGAKRYEADYYPVGYDLYFSNNGYYFQIGMDIGGRFIYDLLSLASESLEIDPGDYGMDESFCNLKGGVMAGLNPILDVGYGMDLDWRVNRYSEVTGAKANQEKIRIGLGPNLSIRFQPLPAITLQPNVSGYYYPFPNEDQSLVPKSFSSFGYRLEAPLVVDLVKLFSPSSQRTFTVSAMPFMGMKEGFYRKLDVEAKARRASASVYGIKFGAYWHIFLSDWNW
jgi:hypothetical protein